MAFKTPSLSSALFSLAVLFSLSLSLALEHSASSYYEHAVSLLDKGDLLAAISAFQQVKILEQHPSPETEFSLAWTFSQLEGETEKERAIEHYRRALRIDPGHWRSSYNLAFLLCERGEYNASLSLYQHATWMAPHMEEIASDRCYCVSQARGEIAAIECISEALGQNPNSLMLKANLGVLLMETGGALSREREPVAERLLRDACARGGESEFCYSLGICIQNYGCHVGEREFKAYGWDSSCSPSLFFERAQNAFTQRFLQQGKPLRIVYDPRKEIDIETKELFSWHPRPFTEEFYEVTEDGISFKRELHVENGPIFRFEVTNVTIVGNYREAMAYDAAGHRVFSLLHGVSLPVHRVPFQKASQRTTLLSRCATILQTARKNYYHNLFEMLPRLYLLRSLLLQDIALSLLLPAENKPFWTFVLRTLGLESLLKENRVHYFDGSVAYQVERLILVDWQRTVVKSLYQRQHTAEIFLPPRVLLENVRSSFTPVGLPQPARNLVIWVSRSKDAKSRKAVNEAEVIETVRTSLCPGEELVVFDSSDYSPHKAALLFQRAATIVAVHGAGLANMMFASAGALVVEIALHEGNHRMFYLHSAAALRHKMVVVNGTQSGQFSSDIKVPLTGLTAALRSFKTCGLNQRGSGAIAEVS